VASLVGVLTALALPGGAQASGCPGALEQEFLKWLDPAYYRIAPGGSFEGPNKGWRFSDGVRKLAVNERFFLRSKDDTRSLLIPRGERVRTPFFCVAPADPTVRFVARNRGSALGSLTVEVVLKTPVGNLVVPGGAVIGGSGWFPTPVIPLFANLTAPLAPGGDATVALRLTSVGDNSAWQIDDLYVDPFRSR
jgi:hypothetical protein